MSTHELVRLRCVPRLLVLVLICVLFGPAERARAQAPDLPQVEVVSGLSLHDSFYDDLDAALSSDLSGRTGIYSGTEFLPYMALAEGQVEQFNDAFVVAFEATLAAVSALFPELGAAIQALKEFIQLVGYLICGGDPFDIGAEITLPQARVFGICTLAADPIQWSPLPDGTGHEILIDASKVGVISQIVILTYLGSPNGLCTWSETEDLKFAFENLQYRGLVTFTPAGPEVEVALVGSLPGVVKDFDGSSSSLTASTLWSTANQVIDGLDLEQKMAEFATTTVRESLEIALRQYWGPYLPHNSPSSLPNWLMNLGGTKQSIRFTENEVSGSVGAATYDPLFADVPGQKTRVLLRNTHSGVIADEEEAVCADGSAFVGASPSLTPNFGVEGTNVEGVYHTSFKNFEHAVVGGIRAAVGLRAVYKDGSPYVVDHSFADLVPEGFGNDLNYLLTDADSPLTDPENPVGTVPISSAQRAALLATPAPGTATLGNTLLNELRFKVAICEERKALLPYPLSSSFGDGTVTHEVLMQVTIERAGAAILTEYFDATFIGNLLLSKVPGGDSTELRTIHSYLSTLVTMGSNLDWQEVTSSTPFSAAPVSLFLRALFGDHQTPTSLADQRAFYLIEGLTGGLVERSAHGMVVLPGLDVAAYTGPLLANDVLAAQYYADDYDLGFVFDRPALCASIVRWGQAPGLVNGTPNNLPRNRTLVIEVDWPEASPLTQSERKLMRTIVTGAAFDSDVPHTLVNPSRYDTGHLEAGYTPQIADESRVVDMSGNRFGAYLPGGGRHWVAATPAGFAELRELIWSNLAAYADVTIELRPYRAFNSLAPCELTYPVGPLVPTGGAQGLHHEDALEDIYEALLFESRLSCKGGGDCDGTRLVARWTAPLFKDCEEDSIGQDRYTFAVNEGALRVPPTSYLFQIQPGCLSGGGGGGHTGGHGFDD